MQVIRLRRGLGSQMRVDILLKISQALGITLTELLDNFAPELVKKSVPTSTSNACLSCMTPGPVIFKYKNLHLLSQMP